MNIYKVERPDMTESESDEYDAFVVVAESEDAARRMHPDGKPENDDPWRWDTWPGDRSMLTVTLIGEAIPGIAAGVVLASFNAG